MNEPMYQEFALKELLCPLYTSQVYERCIRIEYLLSFLDVNLCNIVFLNLYLRIVKQVSSFLNSNSLIYFLELKYLYHWNVLVVIYRLYFFRIKELFVLDTYPYFSDLTRIFIEWVLQTVKFVISLTPPVHNINKVNFTGYLISSLPNRKPK